MIDKITVSLQRIGLEPFLAENWIAAGTEIPDKIALHIIDSNCFVAVLTTNSVNSMWVNQEIGYAYAARQNLLIVPIIESGLQTKGFLQAVEYILLNRWDLSDAIYRLITRLRGYINRNALVLKDLEVVCKQCKLPFKIPLPSQDEINDAIQKNFVFNATCLNPNCRTLNHLSPKTFDVT